MTDELKLEWSTAEVSDGTLTVGLSAKPPKEWRGTFERTATLLSAGSWEVKLHAKKATVEIEPVRADDADRVRQFVEGALLEANAKLPAGEESGEEDDAEGQQHDADAAPEPSADEQLTARFRGFAESDGEDQSEGDSGE
jgi:hypothetical protein